MILILVLGSSVLPITKSAVRAADTIEEYLDTKSAMLVESNTDSSSIEALLNTQTLHPQKTLFTDLTQ